MLLYSLRPADSFRHKLGMGKPIGLGSLRIDINSLELIDRRKRYAEDSLQQPRYNKALEKNWTQIRDGFAQTIETDIRRAIELLGDPARVTKPVHYPQVQNESIEEKTYQWFVANDIGSGKGANRLDPVKSVLEPIDENRPAIPTLKRHPWND